MALKIAHVFALYSAFPSHPTHTSTDWVQNTAEATTKWGDIGDWDVSGVADFSYAFSTSRNVGNTQVNPYYVANPKAVAFVGTAISKWITTSVTSLAYTFYNAVEMNSDLSGWTVGKVTTLQATFRRASKFAGTGLDSWDTTSVTTLSSTFQAAGEMNSDLSAWKVGKVTTLDSTFKGASNFTGMGLVKWDVINATATTSSFDGTSITSCNKRLIADAWASNIAFTNTTYTTDWANETCPASVCTPLKEHDCGRKTGDGSAKGYDGCVWRDGSCYGRPRPSVSPTTPAAIPTATPAAPRINTTLVAEVVTATTAAVASGVVLIAATVPAVIATVSGTASASSGIAASSTSAAASTAVGSMGPLLISQLHFIAMQSQVAVAFTDSFSSYAATYKWYVDK